MNIKINKIQMIAKINKILSTDEKEKFNFLNNPIVSPISKKVAYLLC